MCDHRDCTPIHQAQRSIEQWVQRLFEVTGAIRRGLLSKDALYQFTSPALASELIAHAAIRPAAIKVKSQWCKAEFLAISTDDPPVYAGSIIQRDGRLWVSGLQILPPRRY